MEPQIVQDRRMDFMMVCNDIDMPYKKACLLSNCYINRITIKSVYHGNIEKSVDGIVRIMKMYNKPVDIVY